MTLGHQMSKLAKVIFGVFITAGLGVIFFSGCLTGIGVVQGWEGLTEPGPSVEVQSFVDDLTLVAGPLLAVLLALGIFFRQTRRFRAKEIKAKEAGQKDRERRSRAGTALHYPGVPQNSL
jgi:hypothetical protein